MIRLRFVLIVAVCLSITSAGIIFAQDKPTTGGTLRGQITDTAVAKNPIEGVEVKIVGRSGKEWTVKTDANGNYACSDIPTDRYLISAFKDGYHSPPRKPMMILNGGAYFVPLKMAEKGNIEQLLAVRPEGMDAVVRQIRSLIQRVSESVGERYDLDKAAVKALHRSILDSLERTPGRVSGLGTFLKASRNGNMGLLEVLLSHPICKAALAKHLSETQLQDYLDFTAARQQRNQQAVARRITVALDKALSLTADQRGKVMQSLLDATENEAFPNAMGTLGIGSREAVNLAHNRLKISLNRVLGDAQSKLWRGLVDKVDAEKRPVFNRRKPVGVDKGDEKAADVRKKSIQIGNNTTESEERIKWLAEAKLAAHTELLGPLEEHAARRLALAAKGTVQQDFESEDEDREQTLQELEARFMKSVEAGEMTREQAAVRLQVMREDLSEEEDKNKRHETSASGITKHPLYQQAIKDVLSKEAFAQYKAHQAEREALRLQALRDITVACMDTQLLLSDSQREQLEMAVSHLAPVPYSGSKPAEFMFFQLFRRARNFEILTPWQQGEFERVFAPMMWGQ